MTSSIRIALSLTIIVAEDFKIKNPLKTLDRETLRRLRKFKDKVNKWTIHLTWTRTTEAEYTNSERQSMEQFAFDLLTLSSNFIDECLCPKSVVS